MEIRITAYQPEYAADFRQINLEWLDHYHLTEETDRLMLNDPEGQILRPGGAIFLAKSGNQVAGTVALINEGNGVFELAKMAVVAHFRGMGVSKLLIEKCLEKAEELGAKRIYLQSNSQLKVAIQVYEKYGFHHIPVKDAHYANADIMMEKLL